MSTLKKLMVLPIALAVLAFSAGSASAQVTGPRVAIQLASSGLTSPLVASSTGATMARLILDTTGSTEGVRITSLPFLLALSNGASASTLMNCRVYNEAAPTVALSSNPTATTTLASGMNRITLDAPLILAANTVTTVALRCDIGGNLDAGDSFTFSMNTADVSGTGVVTGLPAIVTIRGAVIPPVIIPGLPTTGAGGNASTNVAVLLASLAVAGAAVFYSRRYAR